MLQELIAYFKAQWLLYVPPGLTLNNATFFPHSVFMCFVWISEQTAIVSLFLHKFISHQPLHTYFSPSIMFRLQSFSHHQGARLFRQQAAHDKSLNGRQFLHL
jgi:hypothetical protein